MATMNFAWLLPYFGRRGTQKRYAGLALTASKMFMALFAASFELTTTTPPSLGKSSSGNDPRMNSESSMKELITTKSSGSDDTGNASEREVLAPGVPVRSLL